MSRKTSTAMRSTSHVVGIVGVSASILALAGALGSAEVYASQASMSPGTVFRDDCTGCPELVVVPSGMFMVGSPVSEEGWEVSESQYQVTIESRFAVGMYEVTFAEWDACVSDGGCGLYHPEDEGWGRGRRPVINVSREDALAYVRWLSRRTGESYRLLTDAEWEYMARAGTTSAWHWGESESGQCMHGNGADTATRKNIRWYGPFAHSRVAQMAMSIQHQWVRLSRTRLGCTTWRATWLSGRTAAGTTPAPAAGVDPTIRRSTATLCCAAVLGAAGPTISARRSVSGLSPGFGATTSASASPAK